jgi:hypothetical protein
MSSMGTSLSCHSSLAVASTVHVSASRFADCSLRSDRAASSPLQNAQTGGCIRRVEPLAGHARPAYCEVRFGIEESYEKHALFLIW